MRSHVAKAINILRNKGDQDNQVPSTKHDNTPIAEAIMSLIEKVRCISHKAATITTLA